MKQDSAVPAAQPLKSISIAGAEAMASARPGVWASVQQGTVRYGWLPGLSLLSSIALLMLAFANKGGRIGAEWAEPLFWLALSALFVPFAWRLFSAEASRQERLGLVLLISLALFSVKLLHSPLEFTFSDEFMHWRTVRDITQRYHLFQANPLLPIASLYPGMAIVTAGLVSVTSLPIFNAGILVLGVGRAVLALSLFLFYEQISRSPRVAGIASLLYMANPNFLFFDAQFAYESLALPFAALTLFLALQRTHASPSIRPGLTMMVMLGVGATVITHHITSYMLITFLICWVILNFQRELGLDLPNSLRGVLRRYAGEMSSQNLPRAFIGQISPLWNSWTNHESKRTGVVWLAGLVIVAGLAWSTYVAQLMVLNYVTPHLSDGVNELIRLIAGEGTGRQLFRTYSGHVAPPVERFTAFGSVILILLGLPIGLFHIWRWHRENVAAMVLAVASLGYPISLALRLTSSGAEASNRSSEFLFLAVAYVLTISVVAIWPTKLSSWRWQIAFVGWATIIFLGGVIIGWAPWARLPGPYLVIADPRSIEPESAAAAEWVHDFLGPDNRVASDRTNRQRLGSVGEQHPVTAYGDRVPIAEVFFSSEIGPDEIDLLQKGRVRYLIVDHRLSTDLPMTGFYFETGEPDSYKRTEPIDLKVLTKFDNMANVHRIYDGGDIVIYDVGELSDVR